MYSGELCRSSVIVASQCIVVHHCIHHSQSLTTAPPSLLLKVKKAYLRVVRFVHPDKLPPELGVYSKLLVERVFIHLTQKYDLYRKAHDL